MSSPDYVSYAYALIVFGGGLMGYVKAGTTTMVKCFIWSRYDLFLI